MYFYMGHCLIKSRENSEPPRNYAIGISKHGIQIVVSAKVPAVSTTCFIWKSPWYKASKKKPSSFSYLHSYFNSKLLLLSPLCFFTKKKQKKNRILNTVIMNVTLLSLLETHFFKISEFAPIDILRRRCSLISRNTLKFRSSN